MEITLLILLGIVAVIGAIVYFAPNEAEREAKVVQQYAALLQEGFVEGAAAGQRTMGRDAKGRCAMGKWKGVDVAVGLFGRYDPPGTITRVSALRRSAPFAAKMLPRDNVVVAEGAPALEAIHTIYEIGFAPDDAFKIVIDEKTASLLAALENCEVEVHGTQVNIQHRGILYDETRLVPLLDATIGLVSRLAEVQGQIAGTNEEDSARRASEVRKFTNPRLKRLTA